MPMGIIALFLVAMRGIKPFDAVDIVKNANGIAKIHAMLFQVQRGLVRVPLELHGQFPLVTLWQYYNPNACAKQGIKNRRKIYEATWTRWP